MYLEKVAVSNFRNLESVDIHLNPKVNYIVGENNLGKSNFLELLDIISNNWAFKEEDFGDKGELIEVEMTIVIDDFEIGIFGDDFSPDDANKIRLKVFQDITDSRPSLMNIDTDEIMSTKYLRKINYIKYDTIKNPNNELRFDKTNSASSFMSFLIGKYTEEGESYLESDKITGLLEHINSKFIQIKAFKDFNINATLGNNVNEMLSRLIFLRDENELPISDTGNGVQFSAIATLNILKKILDIYKSKTINLSDMLVTKNDEERILPITLAIDEPEVHLHPYMQRSLIKYYKRILDNQEADFLELLKYCFDIDGLDGQLIIVTHSTDSLVEDHRNIIRYYRDVDHKVGVVSGMDINLRPEIEKHLIMHFPEMKEAFFSRCSLIVEGETELGAIRPFAEKLEKSFDDYGISVINARGEGTMKPMRNLLNQFRIPSVLVYDNDVNTGEETDESIFYTKEICFEMDIVDTLIVNGSSELLMDVINEYDTNATRHVIDLGFVKKGLKKIEFPKELFIEKKINEYSIDALDLYKAVHFSWLYNKKGVILGRVIGNLLPKEYIPETFGNAINKAVEVSNL